jgi:MoxR-like ATPase
MSKSTKTTKTTKTMNNYITARVEMGKGKKGTSVRAINIITNEDVTASITYMTLSKAYKANMWLSNESGKWRQVPPNSSPKANFAVNEEVKNEAVLESANIMEFLNTCVDKRPQNLFCDDLTWKVICRSTLRGRNTLLTGPTGTGKSQTAIAVAKALDYNLFYINLGSTQDPRGALIGNTHFSKDAGTFFNESAFVRAIQQPNTVVLLDEVSRAHPEAWNILMTVLDPGQRYLRLDEAVNSPTIKVHPTCAFIGTANIGSEYTSVRVMDRALLDRFTINEIPFLTEAEETALISINYPQLDVTIAQNLAGLAAKTRAEVLSDNPKIQTPISTRSVLEMAGMCADGFTLSDCASVAVYPLYSREGGVQSERTYIKQIVQRYVNDNTSDNLVNNTNQTSAS